MRSGARSRLAALAAALVVSLCLALALAGCVGIPSSGSVTVGPVIDDPDNPEVEVVAFGPQPDASPEEILAGFMQAVRAPQNNYGIARQFFAKSVASTWDPDASVLVRSGAATVAPSSDQPDTLTYTVVTSALVDERGRYTEPASAAQTLQFGFVKEAGQWRISEAPPGIVLSRSSFNLVFAEQALYFFDPSYRFLVPDIRWFPKRSTIPKRTVEALLAGPTDWLQQAVVTAFPPATSLDSVTVDTARSVVNLSSEALAASPTARDQMRQQLVATLGIANVVITVGGTGLTVQGGSGNDAIIPSVDSSALVGTATAFGFDAGAGIAPIPGVSAQVVAVNSTAATLANDKQSAVVLSDSGVSVTSTGGIVLLDDRIGLIAPSIDPFGFVWSARGGSAASLTTFGPDRQEQPLQSGLPADSELKAFALSRDGTRIVLYLSTPVGPSLVVAGVIRQDGVPVRLGEPFPLATSEASPVSVTWADDRSVATVDADGQITFVEVGGPTVVLGDLEGATTIAGGVGRVDGLRVLSEGQLWRAQGNGWVPTGISAEFLATKQ